MKEFTFFPDFACNDAFLDVINFTEGCEPGEGLCENLSRYSKVSIDERRKFQQTADETSADSDDMPIDSDAGPGLASIIAKAVTELKRKRRKRKLS